MIATYRFLRQLLANVAEALETLLLGLLELALGWLPILVCLKILL